MFRKVPKNMPNPELLESYLRKPITLVPDTSSGYSSYAEANEKALEQLLPKVGLSRSILTRPERYRSLIMPKGFGLLWNSGTPSAVS
ncbi:MAG: hypothetical protein U5P10_12950 [Spirochaetia bacterium]|nr:hypothetical protein [Spirochaetia bacterium]